MSRLKSSEFDFHLPEDRIAQRPLPKDQQKLLVFNKENGHIEHRKFPEIVDFLNSGDVLVVNNSKVIPAALRYEQGFILIMEPASLSLTDVRAICPARPTVGEVLDFGDAKFEIKGHEPGWDVYIGDLVTIENYKSLKEFLISRGEVPIPTYVRREPDAADEHDFQTIFAKEYGSIAAPTASLHFNEVIVDQLIQKGVSVVEVTLHVGYGTFRSFKSEYVDQHIPDSETFSVSAKAFHEIGAALEEERRIVAVGSTTTRTLESIHKQLANYRDFPNGLSGSTDLFIYPPFKFNVLTGLVTNFHYPRIPVMSLAAAFCGLENLRRIYDVALEHDYMFYSYGDAMLAI